MRLICRQTDMAVRAQWYREQAADCARRVQRSRDPSAKAAYEEMVRAWLQLADSAEQLDKPKQVLPIRPKVSKD
jgi:hypothetical protein